MVEISPCWELPPVGYISFKNECTNRKVMLSPVTNPSWVWHLVSKKEIYVFNNNCIFFYYSLILHFWFLGKSTSICKSRIQKSKPGGPCGPGHSSQSDWTFDEEDSQTDHCICSGMVIDFAVFAVYGHSWIILFFAAIASLEEWATCTWIVENSICWVMFLFDYEAMHSTFNWIVTLIQFH